MQHINPPDPDTPLTQPRPHVSPGQIRLALTCPAKWKYRYIDGLQEPGSVALAQGLAVHDAMEAWLKDLRSYGDIQDVAQDALARHVTRMNESPEGLPDAPATAEDALALIDQTRELAKTLGAWVHDRRLHDAVISVEGEVRYPLTPERDLFGRYDALVNSQGRVTLVDWKTAGKSPSMDRATGEYVMDRAHAIQLLLYVEGLQREGVVVDEIATVTVTKTKTPKVCLATRPVTEEALRFALRVAESAVGVIEGGRYDPNPYGAGFLCSPAYCGFWDRCPAHDPAQEASS